MNRSLSSGEFYGATRTRHELSGFRLLEAIYPPGMSVPKHTHECACFSLMLRGAMIENYRSRTLESRQQTVGFNAASEAHSNTISRDGARFLILEIGAEQTKRAQQYSERFSQSAVFSHGELGWLGLKLFREFLQDDRVSSLAIEGPALEMIATLCRANPLPGSQPPAWLRQAHELVRDQFTQPLSVSAIAGAVGVHPVHLARSFRRYYGAPIGDYVRSLRLEKARTLLSSTALTLAEIAIGAGFYDQSHLARAFRRYLGMTPRQYRRLTQLSAAELHG